jgi:nitrile hydratase accessory protein
VTVEPEVTAMTGPEALPRSNGELVFEAPWQARAFGVAVSLVQAQGLDWEAFRSRLIEQIGAWESEHRNSASDAYEYYEHWLAALERLVLETGMLSAADLELQIDQIAEADLHDHGHDH